MDACRFENRTLYSYPVMDDAARGFDRKVGRRRVLCFAAGALLVLGAGALISRLSFYSLLSIPVLIVALGFLGFGWLSGRGNQVAFRSALLQQTPSREIVCEFYDRDFLIRSGDREQRRNYAEITRWYKGKRTVTLCLDKELYVLDHEGFTAGDAPAFRRFLAARLR